MIDWTTSCSEKLILATHSNIEGHMRNEWISPIISSTMLVTWNSKYVTDYTVKESIIYEYSLSRFFSNSQCMVLNRLSEFHIVEDSAITE